MGYETGLAAGAPRGVGVLGSAPIWESSDGSSRRGCPSYSQYGLTGEAHAANPAMRIFEFEGSRFQIDMNPGELGGFRTLFVLHTIVQT
jgi:hypothetical protein